MKVASTNSVNLLHIFRWYCHLHRILIVTAGSITSIYIGLYIGKEFSRSLTHIHI